MVIHMVYESLIYTMEKIELLIKMSDRWFWHEAHNMIDRKSLQIQVYNSV
jgi:hypothetical protein